MDSKIRFKVNGAEREVPSDWADELLLNYLHEEMDLSGTKYSCGIGQCGACKVIVRKSGDNEAIPTLACFARLDSLDGMEVTTVEGLPGSALADSFLENFAFQCGFSTPGFLMAGIAILEELRRSPIHQDDLDSFVSERLSGHVCRCTGYLRYFESIRNTVLSDPTITWLTEVKPTATNQVVFRVLKKSSNDTAFKAVHGVLECSNCFVELADPDDVSTASGGFQLELQSMRTGERIRDLNLLKYFFRGKVVDVKLASVRILDRRFTSLKRGAFVPVELTAVVTHNKKSTLVKGEALIRAEGANTLRVESTRPLLLRTLEMDLPIVVFAGKFGLSIQEEVEINVNILAQVI